MNEEEITFKAVMKQFRDVEQIFQDFLTKTDHAKNGRKTIYLKTDHDSYL